MSHSQFVQIFHCVDIFNSQQAAEFFHPSEEQQLFLANKQERAKLLSPEFLQHCQKRLALIHQRRESMLALLREASQLQGDYMAANNINPLTGLVDEEPAEIYKVQEDMLCNQRYVRTKTTAGARAPNNEDLPGDSSLSDADSLNFDSEEKEEARTPAELKKPPLDAPATEPGLTQKKPLPRQLLDNPLFDLKPYFRKAGEWDARLRRLEQKMQSLAPDLVFLSLEMHELGINLLAKKLHKFLSVQALVRDRAEAAELRSHLEQEQRE